MVEGINVLPNQKLKSMYIILNARGNLAWYGKGHLILVSEMINKKYKNLDDL
jgi:hypothetical protein